MIKTMLNNLESSLEFAFSVAFAMGLLIGGVVHWYCDTTQQPATPTPGCWFDDPSPGYYTVSVQHSDSTNRYTFNQVKEVKLGWGHAGMK